MAAVERAVSAAGHVIVEMADFPAADQPAAQLCADLVRGCDVYVGVLGTRYGSPVRDKPEVSYTELEFDTATEAGLDRLVFLLDTDAENAAIPPSELIDAFKSRQDAFRRRVQDGRLVAQHFAQPAELGQLVERSLRALADRRRRIGGVIEREQVRGWPLGEVIDPFALEVHRPVKPEDPQPGLPVLPAYVPRGHDAELGQVVRAAVEGSSGIAVLVGGSSTGKTRACWEALQILRDQEGWRLWHPIDPSRPGAALLQLPGIGPRTVVWLNEAQLYLDPPDSPLGERVAAGLRELLRDPARAPVLVLATLWPQFWDGLTAGQAGGADLHAQARELLDGHDITVPAAFTAAELPQLSQMGDTRLAQAAAEAQDGQVIQFLAGAPELLARYRRAPPAAAALIGAAMDARRLGTGIALPQAFLEAAAPPPGYLTDTEWDAQDDDWLEQALRYTTKDAKGVRGPLTRIRPRPARSGATGSGSRDSEEQPADGPAGTQGGPLYRLADYLDQHGRVHRKGHIPPAGFWAAAARHALPGDQAALGDAAHARGLYRAAAQLHKNAAASGNLDAASYLVENPPCLRTDGRPALWAMAQAPLTDPEAVANLLNWRLAWRERNQAAALLHRDPAAHVSLGDLYGVAGLLGSLRAARRHRVAGAQEQATALAVRAAAQAPLTDPGAVVRLLDSLSAAGAQEQATALAVRAAAQAPLTDPGAVVRLLDSLRAAGVRKQATALVRRDPAAQVSLADPGAVAGLLDSLRAAGARRQVTVLAVRAAAQAPLTDPLGVAWLLVSLRTAGAQDQATALADRFLLAHPDGVDRLLDSLRTAGAQDQATMLADWAAAQAPLTDPGAVASLLDRLQAAGAQEQVTALVHRDPAAQVSLTDPGAVVRLLDSLRAAGAQEQVTALVHRDPAAQVSLTDPGAVAGLLDSLRAAGAQEQVTALVHRDPAAQVSLTDPYGVARLLDSLRAAGAQDQVTALADRAAAQVPLTDPDGVARLLRRLRATSTRKQATALADRVAAQAPLTGLYDVARLLDSLRTVRTRKQATALADRVAAQVPLTYLPALPSLLDRLRAADAQDQATALADRAAAQVPVTDPGAVASMLYWLQTASAQDQVTALVHRDPAAQVSLTDPGAVASLLDSLRAAGAQDQVTALVHRDPAAQVPLTDPGAVPACWTACGRRARRTRSPRWPTGPPPRPP